MRKLESTSEGPAKSAVTTGVDARTCFLEVWKHLCSVSEERERAVESCWCLVSLRCQSRQHWGENKRLRENGAKPKWKGASKTICIALATAAALVHAPRRVWLEEMAVSHLQECGEVTRTGCLASTLAGEFFEYWVHFKEKTHSGIFFFFPRSLSKVLICIRLSRVMTFHVINVTSIIPLNISCLRLRNVNVSDYMAVTRDPEERENGNTGLGTVGGPARQLLCHPLPRIWKKHSLSVRRMTQTHTHAQEHANTELFLF